MNQREKDSLDRHITGNYGEDQIEQLGNVNENRDESGRPPIDAPPTEHRRWFNEKMDKLDEYDRMILRASVRMFENPKDKLARIETLIEQRKQIRDDLTQAYMDGNEAERKTLEFKANEFEVRDDGDFIVAIDEYADRGMVDPPRYAVTIHHGQKQVLSLRGLTARAFDLEPSVARNINSEGP